MARLSHPNVVAIHDAGAFSEGIFLAMDLVDGQTLAEWMRGQHPWKDVVRVFRDAGRGLAAAHRAGIVHRDFKPSNVLIDAEGRARVGDFGLARASGDPDPGGAPRPRVPSPVPSALDSPLTATGAVMGTPGYMA